MDQERSPGTPALHWQGGSWQVRYDLPSLGRVVAWFTENGIRRIDLPDGEDAPRRQPKADPNAGLDTDAASLTHATASGAGFQGHPESASSAAPAGLVGLPEPPGFREPPARVRRLAEELGALLKDYDRGEPVSFDHLPLDMTGLTPFRRRVYEETRKVDWGQTTTYGRLAERSGRPGGARAVGQAMGANPFALVVP